MSSIGDDQQRRDSVASSRRGSILIFKNKRTRAYTISNESTQFLLNSINEYHTQKTTWRSFMNSIIGFAISTYLILLNQQSRPPGKFLYILFFILAILVSLDILVSLSYAFHLVFPSLHSSPTLIVYLFVYFALPIFSPFISILAVRSILCN